MAVLVLAGACSSSKDDDASRTDEPDTAEEVAAAAEPEASKKASIVIESTDGSAFEGSRTIFAITAEDSGESTLVTVDGTTSGTRTVVPLDPGTYRIAPAGDVQVSPTGSSSVRDLSTSKVVIPKAEAGADLSEPVAHVTFGLDVQRSPFDLTIDEVASTSATLTWNALAGASVAGYQLRLTDGAAPATDRADGTEVPLSSPTATTAALSGLTAGQDYTATLFASGPAGDELAFRSVTFTTPPADGSEAAYALAPNTIIPTDFDALDPRLLDDGTIQVDLSAAHDQSSTTEIPGVEADALADGCVVGTPILVTSEVAGDDVFYGLVASCEEAPASWRGQAGGTDQKEILARISTGEPIAAVVPYLSFHSTGYERCVVTGGAAGKDDPDPCEAADTDGDGVTDNAEAALGLDPNDGKKNWDSLVAGGSTAPNAPQVPISDLTAPAGLAGGPLQVTILWATGDDLDLTVADPSGAVVAGQTTSTSGGRMTTTDEGGACTSRDVRAENASWAAAPPSGTYTIQVAQFAGTADSPKNPCTGDLQARLQVRVNGEIKVDRVVSVDGGCPNTIEVVDGQVNDSAFLAAACSYDGTRWRMVAGLADTNGDGVASKGDTVRFFEYPKTFDGTEYEKIPMDDCVVTEFEAKFTGPPDLRVRGATCSVYYRSERDPGVKVHQDRFGADSRRAAGNRPGPGNFDLDIWDVIQEPRSTTKDRIEDTVSKRLVEQLSVRDDDFLRVDINFVAAPPDTWRSSTEQAATASNPSRWSMPAKPKVECASEGKATFSPRFGLDKFHDVSFKLKKTKLSWDVNAGVTAYVNPEVKVEGKYECGLDLKGVSVQLTAVPIPINLEVSPTVSAGVEGKVSLEGPKLELTLGVDTDGYLDASVKTCETLWFLPDVPCGVGLDTKFNAKPIAKFTHGGVTATMEATAKAGVGAEATIAVGVDSGLLTAKAGFAVTLEPVAATLTGSGTTELVKAPETTTTKPTTTAPTTKAPPYTRSEYEAIWLSQVKAAPAGTPILVGPVKDGRCAIANDKGTEITLAGQRVTQCADALCTDGDSVDGSLSAGGGAGTLWTTDHPCDFAKCVIGGAVVDSGQLGDNIAECPQVPSGSTSSGSPGTTEPSSDDGGGSFCLKASLGASVSVALKAEVWLVVVGDEWEYPIFTKDVAYPGAEFEIGECEDG